jgi:hypothetical protein
MAALKYIKQRGGENAWFGITSPMILDSGVAPMVTDPDILESIMKGGYAKMQQGGSGCGCGMTGGSPVARATQRGGSTAMRVIQIGNRLIFEKHNCKIVFYIRANEWLLNDSECGDRKELKKILGESLRWISINMNLPVLISVMLVMRLNNARLITSYRRLGFEQVGRGSLKMSASPRTIMTKLNINYHNNNNNNF